MTGEDGEQIRSIVRKELADDGFVNLCFRGVESVTALFCNASIGWLNKDFSAEFLRTHIKISRASKLTKRLLETCIDNCAQYYSLDQKSRDRIDAVFSGKPYRDPNDLSDEEISLLEHQLSSRLSGEASLISDDLVKKMITELQRRRTTEQNQYDDYSG